MIEILSELTEAFDRGDKFADYQTIDSLQEYLLISTRQQRFRKFSKSLTRILVLSMLSE